MVNIRSAEHRSWLRTEKGVNSMSNQATSRKSLWMALLAAVVVLTMVLCLAGCNNEQAEGETTAPTASVGGETEQIDLYWNMDRALYDGKSEAGMSSREPGEDGYFRVRFFKDGEIVELRVADRKTVNAMEVQDIMGLEFDEDGVVIGVIPVDDLPIEKLAWQFYVQSAGGKLIKANSSASLNGMEVLLETNENTGIWDMTGLSGDVGCEADPMQLDRILALGDADGNVLHVFIYERPNYMKTHEGECEHCQKTVTWYEWTKESALPLTTGHYQLMVDVSNVGQHSMPEDCKLCVDLNGHRVDGRSGARIYSLHNAGTELALMDTSEAKTGRIAAHGQGDQGMCVWLRYGVFYLYDGILDGSDAKTYLNGPTVNMGSNTYFYMYGGELIGGTAAVKSNGKGGWTGGYGGTLFIGSNSKFVMNDGIIRGGRAKAAITSYTADKKPNGYSNGVGGNIYASTGAIIELNGGEIRGGVAENHSGNIYLGGKVEMTINATLINGGKAASRTNNGGNLFVSSTAKVVMNGGTIRNGQVYNCGGNVYCNGRFQMNDGIITDGKCISWDTKKANSASSNRNVFSVNGDFYMYGGRIAGGFQAISSTDATKNPTIVLVSARSVIFDEDGTGPHLTLSNTSGGGMCTMYVGQMHDEGKVGISGVQQAIFTKPTNVNNTDNFISDIEGADIGWSEQGLIIGKVHCLCSQDPEIGDDEHKLGCDKIQYAWTPWTSTSSLPSTPGYYYLTKDVTSTGTTVKTEVEGVHHIALDLNGKTIQSNGGRVYSLFENNNTYLEDGKTIAPNIEGVELHLTLTDTLGGGTVNFKTRTDSDQGTLIWGRYTDSKVNILGGTYNCQNVTSLRHAGAVISAAGELNIYDGTFNGGNSTNGGIISGNNINIYGGTISGGTASKYGGNIYSTGTVNIYGGTITEGQANGVEAYAQGGNIWVGGSKAVLNIDGNAVISNGYAYSTMNGASSWAPGGNIYVNGGAKVTIGGGAVIEGGDGSDGNNLYMTSASTTMNLLDCTVNNVNGRSGNNITVEGGTLTIDGAEIINECENSRNIATNNSGSNVGNIVIKSGTISGGTRTNDNGGNIFIGQNDTLTISGGTITGGYSNDSGGNIACYGKLTMTGGLVTNGKSGNEGNGMNISMILSVEGNPTTFTMSGGTIAGGLHFNNYKGNVAANISGNPVVNKELATANKPSYSMKLGANDLKVGTMTSGAKIYVSGTEGVFTNPVDASYVNYFISEVEGSSVMHTADGLFLGKSMCVCGGKAVGMEGHTCKNVLWTAWTSSSSLPTAAGNYYLTKDINRADQTVIYGVDVNIDLNGHNINFNVPVRTDGYRFLRVQRKTDANGTAYGPGAHVSFTDSTNNPGTVKVVMPDYSGAAADVQTKMLEGNQGMLFWLWDQSSITIYDGIFDGTQIAATKKDGATIDAGGGSTLNLYNGTIKPGTIGWSHNIRISGTMNMYGGEITGGTANNAGNIGVNGTLYIKGGTITGGTANNGTGGNIRVNANAKVYMSAGTISGGTGNTAGNIRIENGGLFEITGGTISGGTALTGNGGSIMINSTGTMNIKGGTITGGSGPDSGGNIANYGTLKMSGGLVTNGKSGIPGNGMNISTICSNADTLAVFELTGGTIAGGVHFNNAYDYVKANISGNPVVDKELATANKPTYSMALTINKLNVGTMESGAKIMVSGREGVFTNAVAENYTDYFKSEDADRVVGHTAEGLFFGKGMCACGGKAVGVGDHTCEAVIWQPWNGTSAQLSTLPTINNQINVYMTGNATLGSQIATGSKKINIDLNGYNLTNTWRLALLQNGGVIGITDTVGTGKITFNGPNNDHSSILMQGGSTLNIYAGTLTRSATSTNKVQSGGIIGSDATSVVNMYGGTISNGRVVRRNNGGTGIGGTGGNVNLKGTFNMWAGTITGGVAVNETTPDNSSYINWAAGGNVFITGSGVFNMYGGTVSNGNAANEGGNFDVQGTLNVTGGTIIGGVSNGSGGNVFVNHGGKANIGAITISGGKASNGGNIFVSNENGGGKVTLNGTTLTGGTATGTGGNVYLNAGTEHSFTNVNISGGVATGSGGNICTNGSSKLTINSGTISGGTATASQYSGGGNIVVWGSSTVDIKGGTISGGLGKFGGSILADGSTKLNISGGTITGGETENQGGNILLWGTSKLTITGGTIENGRMRKGGGGGNIHVSSTASMTMTGGIIRNGGLLNADNSVNYGETTSNVAYGGVVDMSGGHIYGCIGGNGTLNLSGSAKIYHVRNNQNYYQDNNLCLGGKIFIGQLNSDAVIGVMTTDSSFAANTDTNLTKPFATVNSGVSVDVNQFYGRTVLNVGGNWVGSSDYKVVLDSGKLYLVPTT